jgi:hypothetical protein
MKGRQETGSFARSSPPARPAGRRSPAQVMMIAEPIALAFGFLPRRAVLRPFAAPTSASTRRSRGPARNAANRQTAPAPSDSYDPRVQTPTKRKDSRTQRRLFLGPAVRRLARRCGSPADRWLSLGPPPRPRLDFALERACRLSPPPSALRRL